MPHSTRGAPLADALRALGGVVLLIALAVAPLNYGSTRPVPFETLIALTLAGGCSWFLSTVVRREFPLPPWPARIGILLVVFVALAWLLAFTPPEVPAFTRSHFARIQARWPHSVVPRDFSSLLLWALAALIAFVALWDLARQRAWRTAIAGVILWTAVTVGLLGLLQNATRARGIYWDTEHRLPGAFFGPFFHHTSAGAYLNTAWPLGLALALAAIRRNGGEARTRLTIAACLIGAALILAAHGGHVSRLPQVIALAALVVFALWAGVWRVLGEVRGLRIALGAVALIVGVIVVAGGAGRIKDIRARWSLLSWEGLRGDASRVANVPPERDWRRLMRDDLFVPSDHSAYPLGDRGAMYAAAIGAIRERPWFGWGPGGWTAAAARHSSDPFVRTFFLIVQFTHEDYLQTWVEWGLIGAAGWLLLVPGGGFHALRRLGRQPATDFIGAGATVALGAVLTQSLIDFPQQIPAIQYNVIALAALAWSAGASELPARKRSSSPSS